MGVTDLERDTLDWIRCHPLAPALPLLRQTLVDIADQAMHVMIVTDEHGRTLHTTERPARTHHPWTCAAAPIHDPETGELIGAVDIAGPGRTFHPTTLKLVAAAARLAECHLVTHVAVRDERLLARGRSHLTALRGAPGALVAPDGRVLAAQPAGWLPARITLPNGGDRVRFRGGEGVLEPLAEGWLLRAASTTLAGLPALTMPFRASGAPSRTSMGSRSVLRCAPPGS